MTFRLRLHGAVAGATACTALLAGCGTSGAYYMVREPGSATPYYTTSISTSGSAVKFKDAKTGSGVTLQSSEVRKISKEEYAQAMTPPTPTEIAQIVAFEKGILTAQSKDQAEVLRNISSSWSRLAGQIDRYNALVREQDRIARK